MGKKKTKAPAKKGAPDHFTGFKYAFLTSRSGLYQQALASNTVGSFYDKVTREFIAKYGKDEPFNGEPVDDPPEPDDMDEDEGSAPTKEEAAASALLFTKLRTVSVGISQNVTYFILIFCQKLSQWYRRKYKSPEAPNPGPAVDNPFMAVLAANVDKAPWRLTPMHHYFKIYYKSRIKATVDQRFAIAKRAFDGYMLEKAAYDEAVEAGDETVEEPVVVQKPIPVQMRATVGKEFWLLETPEFREATTLDAEQTHKMEMEGWEAAKSVPKTPQQFHQWVARWVFRQWA